MRSRACTGGRGFARVGARLGPDAGNLVVGRQLGGRLGLPLQPLEVFVVGHFALKFGDLGVESVDGAGDSALAFLDLVDAGEIGGRGCIDRAELLKLVGQIVVFLELGRACRGLSGEQLFDRESHFGVSILAIGGRQSDLF
jgi:hypothetical protein